MCHGFSFLQGVSVFSKSLSRLLARFGIWSPSLTLFCSCMINTIACNRLYYMSWSFSCNEISIVRNFNNEAAKIDSFLETCLTVFVDTLSSRFCFSVRRNPFGFDKPPRGCPVPIVLLFCLLKAFCFYMAFGDLVLNLEAFFFCRSLLFSKTGVVAAAMLLGLFMRYSSWFLPTSPRILNSVRIWLGNPFIIFLCVNVYPTVHSTLSIVS